MLSPRLPSALIFAVVLVVAQGSSVETGGDAGAVELGRPEAVGGGPSLVWIEREAVLMGTRLRARIGAADREVAVAASERTFAEIRRLERVLSTWRGDTEMGRLNGYRPETPFRPSRELFSLLLETRAWSRATGGAFDPGIGPLVDAWDLRGRGRRPSGPELERARATSGFGQFALDVGGGTIRRLDAEAWIDAGAFGKGAALRAARRVLLSAGIRSALLDFGGQVVAIGSDEGGSGWTLGVAHPKRRAEPVGLLRLRDQSAATTSASERFVTVDGEVLGHVLDPRTGRPVPAWGSVTVVADDPLVADVCSTALFVLGPREGMRWVEAREGIAVLFLEAAGGELEATWNERMEPVWLRLEEEG